MRSILALVTASLLIGLSWPAHAHAPGVVLSGLGTATIDGMLSPGEWDGAASIDFLVNVPAADGGGTTPATLFVMNDGTNLYLGLKIVRSGLGSSNVSFTFDNDHDGVPGTENGDDAVLFSAAFFDDVRTNEPPCPPGLPPGACGPLDTAVGGTTDGHGAATNNDAFSFYEISHPLNSGDLFLELAIDIEPGTSRIRISRSRTRTIDVAILSSADFNAPAQVDRDSLTFGPTGDEPSLRRCSSRSKDVNRDGLRDLVCSFDARTAEFQVGDTVGVLKGLTLEGIAIVGADSVHVVR